MALIDGAGAGNRGALLDEALGVLAIGDVKLRPPHGVFSSLTPLQNSREDLLRAARFVCSPAGPLVPITDLQWRMDLLLVMTFRVDETQGRDGNGR